MLDESDPQTTLNHVQISPTCLAGVGWCYTAKALGAVWQVEAVLPRGMGGLDPFHPDVVPELGQHGPCRGW